VTYLDATPLIESALLQATRDHLASGLQYPPAELLARLGCTYKTDDYGSEDVIIPPVQEDLSQSGACLTLLLEDFLRQEPRCTFGFTSLLTGLIRHAGPSPSTKPKATELATLILLFIDVHDRGVGMDRYVSSKLCDYLNGWLEPGVAWQVLPTLGVTARAMFGDAWCYWRLPASIDDPQGVNRYREGGFAGDIVWRERPAFIDGLCPDADVVQGMDLPDSMV
jgi:hypothetical protein